MLPTLPSQVGRTHRRRCQQEAPAKHGLARAGLLLNRSRTAAASLPCRSPISSEMLLATCVSKFQRSSGYNLQPSGRGLRLQAAAAVAAAAVARSCSERSAGTAHLGHVGSLGVVGGGGLLPIKSIETVQGFRVPRDMLGECVVFVRAPMRRALALNPSKHKQTRGSHGCTHLPNRPKTIPLRQSLRSQ